MKIYHIDSSARKSESVSKSLAKLLVEKIKKSGDTVLYRDVSTGLPFVSGIKGAGFIIPENYDPKLNPIDLAKIAGII